MSTTLFEVMFRFFHSGSGGRTGHLLSGSLVGQSLAAPVSTGKMLNLKLL